MSPELLASPTEAALDPWQAAFDIVFAEKFSEGAIQTQAQEVTSLRTEALQFLSISENVLGIQAMQRYATQLCASHPHMSDAINNFMEVNAHDNGDAHDHQVTDEADSMPMEHDDTSCDDCRNGRRCSKKK